MPARHPRPDQSLRPSNPPREKVFSLKLKYFPDSFAPQEEGAAGAAQRSKVPHGEGLVDTLPPDVWGSPPPGINNPRRCGANRVPAVSGVGRWRRPKVPEFSPSYPELRAAGAELPEKKMEEESCSRKG